MELKTPKSLNIEHEELHAQLAKATKAGGATVEAAKTVAKALHPHFLKEEGYALPPLGLLPILAEDGVLPEMDAASILVGEYLKKIQKSGMNKNKG